MSQANNTSVSILLSLVGIVVFALPLSTHATVTNCSWLGNTLTCNDDSNGLSAVAQKNQQGQALYESIQARYDSSDVYACYQQGKCASQDGAYYLSCVRWVESCASTKELNRKATQANAARQQAQVQQFISSQDAVLNADRATLQCADGYVKTATGCSPIQTAPVVPNVASVVQNVPAQAPVANVSNTAPVLGSLSQGGMPVLNNGTPAATSTPVPDTQPVKPSRGFLGTIFRIWKLFWWL